MKVRNKLSLFNLFLILSIYTLSLSFFACGGGGEPGAPAAAPTPAVAPAEAPAQISGEIQSADIEGGAFSISVLDATGKKIAEFQTDEKGDFLNQLPENLPVGDLILRAERADETPLEVIVRPEKGKIKNVTITDTSSVVLLISRILFPIADNDNIEAMTHFIEERFNQQEVAQAAQELRSEGEDHVFARIFQEVLLNYNPPVSD